MCTLAATKRRYDTRYPTPATQFTDNFVKKTKYPRISRGYFVFLRRYLSNTTKYYALFARFCLTETALYIQINITNLIYHSERSPGNPAEGVRNILCGYA